MRRKILILCLLVHYFATFSYASEVLEDTHTQVIVRNHPKTGKPYVSIIPGEKEAAEDPFTKQKSTYSRPDYRMLDPKVKSGEVPYDGPYSSSTKVYVFAATLATLGVAGGAIGLATVPASTAASNGGVGLATVPLASTSAATGGAGIYFAASGAVAAVDATSAIIANRSAPKNDNWVQISKAESGETESGGKTHAPILARGPKLG